MRALLLSVLILAGCDATGPDAGAVGMYQLHTVNSHSLPAPWPGGTILVTGGYVEVRADSTVTVMIQREQTDGAGVRNTTDFLHGRHGPTTDKIPLIFDDLTIVAFYERGVISIPSEVGDYLFKRP